MEGRGLPKDYANALTWILKADESDEDPNAQFHIGLLYRRVSGVAEDDSEAADWFRKAAEQG